MKYYHKYIIKSLLFLSFALSAAIVNGQDKNRKAVTIPRVFISGQIDSLPSNFDRRLKISIYRKSPVLNRQTDISVLKTSIDANGKFHFVVDSVYDISRLIFEYGDGNELINNDFQSPFANRLLIESGDRLNIKTTWTKSGGASTNPVITGKGSEKFEFMKEIEPETFNIDAKIDPLTNQEYGPFADIIKNKNYLHVTSVVDSILRRHLLVLNKYRNKISNKSYEVIKADIEGILFRAAVGIYPLETGINKKRQGFADFQEMLRRLQILPSKVITHSDGYQNIIAEIPSLADFKKKLSMKFSPSKAIVHSENYQKFLIGYEEAGVRLLHDSKVPDFREVYYNLKNKYSGLLREKLITAYLSSQDRSAINSAVFDPTVDDALKFVRPGYLRNYLVFKSRLEKGGTPYDFTMPIDSSNRSLSLNDLKGDVVLIDEYAYTCEACVSFAQAFHKAVYPLFKENPHFKVVSIFGGYGENGTKDKFYQRLRNVGDDGKPAPPQISSTFPDNINLFGGNGVLKGSQQMNQYYEMQSMPLVVLVDKKGKIVSTTATSFPLIQNTNDSKIPELIDLIKKTLAEPN